MRKARAMAKETQQKNVVIIFHYDICIFSGEKWITRGIKSLEWKTSVRQINCSEKTFLSNSTSVPGIPRYPQVAVRLTSSQGWTQDRCSKFLAHVVRPFVLKYCSWSKVDSVPLQHCMSFILGAEFPSQGRHGEENGHHVWWYWAMPVPYGQWVPFWMARNVRDS